MIPFEHSGPVITARLQSFEAELLGDLAGQLIVLLGDRTGVEPGGDPEQAATAALLAQLGIGGSESAPLDPALARLLPDAYRNDDAASTEHRRLTELGLVDRKIANANIVVATVATDPVELDEQSAQSWLRTLTDLRLTLAARLHIEEDGDDGTGDQAMLDVYDWLGYLQGTLLDEIERMKGDHEL
ncbi:hypothetical protein IWX81_000190 [Salinibacterium sp. CAN_S4]|uniref:DUF2017 domain-containing protein n=1 Tax=Salinibacterium sp. CAN_S4 TaxID=2787727 RepID=UPI0018EFD622